MSAIAFRNVTKGFGGVPILDDISFDVPEGEFLALLGASGSGKSTTLRLLAGLEDIDSGSIELAGKPVSGRGLHVPANRRDLGFVFQSYALWPHLSVIDNVAYPLRARGIPRSEARERARKSLDRVHLADYAQRRIGQLSGGQQQRVGLARAIVAEPRIILFDEPLSNLDAQLRAELRREIKRLHQQLGFTAVYVTHDYTEALSLADRIAVFHDGGIAQLDAAARVFNRPATRFIARFVGFDSFTPGRVLETGTGLSVRLGPAGTGADAGSDAQEPDNTVPANASGTPIAGDGAALGGSGTLARLPRAEGLRAGDAVLVATRAQHLIASPLLGGSEGLPADDSGPDTADWAPGIVEELDFNGAEFIATVRLDGFSLRAALLLSEWGSAPAQALSRSGGQVRVRLDWSNAVAIRSDDV